MSLSLNLVKSYLWQRERIVGKILCGSVVAKMKMTCSGGSSNVFKRALKAPVDNIWTSSIMYTLYLPKIVPYLTLSINSLISSTPLLLAASSSKTSGCVLSIIALQFLHSLH